MENIELRMTKTNGEYSYYWYWKIGAISQLFVTKNYAVQAMKLNKINWYFYKKNKEEK